MKIITDSFAQYDELYAKSRRHLVDRIISILRQKEHFISLLTKLLFILTFSLTTGFAQTSTIIPSGSFIINMGIVPQTIANGMKPYGLLYALLNNHTPVDWVINSSKAKDGVDFVYNGVNYSGGPFIIEAKYRSSAVNGLITTWQTLGVVGVTTTSPITVPVFVTFYNVPRWTLDQQNGSIAENFLIDAGIPSTAYGGSSKSGWKTPTALTCCDDIFVLPHADPSWYLSYSPPATPVLLHGNLYYWNLSCNGAIWLGCHAGSALTDMFDPATPSNQTNFLVTKTTTPSGTGPYFQNSLVLWGNHSAGTPPYNYAYPTDPIMQFMGTIDAAQQNGSEQIYIPLAGSTWNPGAKVYVWDPTPANTLGTGIFSAGPAATLISGRGFDNPSRGRILMEAAHNIEGSGTSNVAAMRAFLNFSFLAVSEKAVLPTITGLPATINSGQSNSLSVTLPTGVSPSNYTYSWTCSCGGTFLPSSTSQNVTFTAPVETTPTSCTITATITDPCGRVTFDTHGITVQCNMQVASAITNLCSGNSTGGSVAMTISNGTGPFNWSWTKTGNATLPLSGSGTSATSPFSVSNLTVGTYAFTVTANSGAGCMSTFTVTLTQSPAIIINATPTTALCNGSSTGTINVSPAGGIPNYTYSWADGPTTQNRTGLASGNYTLTVTDSKGCTAISAVTVTQPAVILIAPTSTNVTCFGINNGTINPNVSGGTSPYTYLWNDGSSVQNRTGLAPGTYSVTVTDANSCTKASGMIPVTQPSAALNVSISSQTNVLCNGALTGAVTVAATGGTSSYSYAWTGPGAFTATGSALTNLAAGTYTVTVTDAHNCTNSLPVTITQPVSLNLSTVVTRPTCPSTVATLGNNGAINLSVTGGSGSYTYLWTASNGGIIPVGQSGNQNLTMLVAGSYHVQVTDGNGCSATSSVILTNINPNPVQPASINH